MILQLEVNHAVPTLGYEVLICILFSDTEYLFQSPPLPIPPASSLVSIDPSFQKYKVALQKQLMGRTALLDEVLKSIESCARTIRHDLDEVIKGEGADTE